MCQKGQFGRVKLPAKTVRFNWPEHESNQMFAEIERI
jgi:hypothetical protein